MLLPACLQQDAGEGGNFQLDDELPEPTNFGGPTVPANMAAAASVSHDSAQDRTLVSTLPTELGGGVAVSGDFILHSAPRPLLRLRPRTVEIR